MSLTVALLGIVLISAFACALVPTRECGALTTSGNHCRRVCAPGFTKCNLHGGHTPLARQAASEALAKAALPSAAALLDIVSSYGSTRCDKCGMPTGDPGPVIRAAQIILDRTGFHPGVDIHVQEAPKTDTRHAAWIPLERAEQIVVWVQEAKEAMERGDPQPDDVPITPTEPAVDAEVIADEPAVDADIVAEMEAAKDGEVIAEGTVRAGAPEAVTMDPVNH